MHDLKQLEKEKKESEEKLRFLKKTKFKYLIKPIIIFPIATLVIPFIPLKGNGKNMATLIGAEKSILSLGVFFTVVLLWAVIVKLNEYKADKFDVETEIELIENKIAKLKK